MIGKYITLALALRKLTGNDSIVAYELCVLCTMCTVQSVHIFMIRVCFTLPGSFAKTINREQGMLFHA